MTVVTLYLYHNVPISCLMTTASLPHQKLSSVHDQCLSFYKTVYNGATVLAKLGKNLP